MAVITLPNARSWSIRAKNDPRTVLASNLTDVKIKSEYFRSSFHSENYISGGRREYLFHVVLEDIIYVTAGRYDDQEYAKEAERILYEKLKWAELFDRKGTSDPEPTDTSKG